jgi:hypothetical protein
LFESRASRGQLVEVRRFNVRCAIKADILPTKIIGNDVNDIQFVICGAGWIRDRRQC